MIRYMAIEAQKKERRVLLWSQCSVFMFGVKSKKCISLLVPLKLNITIGHVYYMYISNVHLRHKYIQETF